VDVRQQLHLKQAFAIAKRAWWKELWADNIEFFHAFNGFIKLKEWAMSTRHGTVIFLEALIEEGNERTEKILEEKWRTGDKKLSPENIQAITIWAIKYSYLTQDREKDVVFDWDKALNFEGHSGPYIQYAYVRARKISDASDIRHISDRKYPAWEEQDFSQARHDKNFEIWNLKFELSQSDKSLIRSLARFSVTVDTVAKTYKPHHLALYAYDIAVEFNSFYVHTPKILEEQDAELKAFRLALVAKTAETLKKSFELLAIEMPSEM
jgi:arginyl-tRNA synthetase